MNVLLFSHSSELAGAERSLLELVKELINGYETICTIVLPSHGPLEDLLRKAGAAILIAPINWWCNGVELLDKAAINQLYYQSFNWLTANLYMLRQVNPDVVLTNTLVIPWGALAAGMLERPHIWMVNEFGELDHELKFYLPFRQVLDFIEASSDKIVTRSKAVQSELFPHHNSSKVNTIYRYVDISNRDNLKQDTTDNHFLNPDAYHIIVLGTIMKSKGQDEAVRSVIELVKNRHRKVDLVLAGSAQPGFQYFLQSIISSEGAEDYIRIIPFQNNVLSIICSADLVLVCSKMEAFSRVIVEAMLMEKAVIGTNTGGTPELIIDGETGLLYTPGNYVQLADQIEKLLDDPSLQNKLVNNAINFVRQTFTKELYGGEYYKILVDLKDKEFQMKEGISSFLSTQYEAAYQALITQTAEQEALLQSISARLAEREALVQSLSSRLAEQEALVQSLSAQVDQLKPELEQTKEEAVNYLLSRSWRMTRPFRKIYWFIKGEKNV